MFGSATHTSGGSDAVWWGKGGFSWGSEQGTTSGASPLAWSGTDNPAQKRGQSRNRSCNYVCDLGSLVSSRTLRLFGTDDYNNDNHHLNQCINSHPTAAEKASRIHQMLKAKVSFFWWWNCIRGVEMRPTWFLRAVVPHSAELRVRLSDHYSRAGSLSNGLGRWLRKQAKGLL